MLEAMEARSEECLAGLYWDAVGLLKEVTALGVDGCSSVVWKAAVTGVQPKCSVISLNER